MDRPKPVKLGMSEASLFLALAARDGVRFPGLPLGPIPRTSAATAVGRSIGISRADVLAYCERWVAFGWYDYRDTGAGGRDADAGWITESGKIAATLLWGGGDAPTN